MSCIDKCKATITYNVLLCRARQARRARAHPRFLKLRPLTRLIKVIRFFFNFCFVICVFLTAPSVSPEEMAKKQQLERMRKEHIFALKHEGDTMCDIHVHVHVHTH